VTKVHREAEVHYRRGREIVLIGHAGHPEVIGTMGQLPPGAVVLVQSEEEARAFQPRDPAKLAWVSQTTLSVDDTAAIVTVLRQRFPDIVGPHRDDICYATTNRQEAVKRVAGMVDAMIVVGAPNSSNSQRLREVAVRAGCRLAALVQGADDIDWASLDGARRVGITAGASAPEILVEAIIDAFADRYAVTVEVVTAAEEDVVFNLPRALRDAAE
jgi:4-hydroxy-3-methylbut-2-enyl diphosphate reductase